MAATPTWPMLVLSEEQSRGVDTTKVYAAAVTNKKKTSVLIKALHKVSAERRYPSLFFLIIKNNLNQLLSSSLRLGF